MATMQNRTCRCRRILDKLAQCRHDGGIGMAILKQYLYLQATKQCLLHLKLHSIASRWVCSTKSKLDKQVGTYKG